MKRSKYGKVKRHAKIYRYNRSRRTGPRIGWIIFFVLLLAALAFVGYSVAGPVMNFFKELSKPPESDISTSSGTSSVTDSSSESSSSSSEPSPTQQGMRAAYLDVSEFDDSQSVQIKLASLKEEGYQAVVVQLKDDMGNVYFDTSYPYAIDAGAVQAENDPAEIAKLISDAGLTPVADLHTLKDHVVPKRFRDTSYTMNNGAWTWYDDDPDQGGQPWLNPYQEKAREYIETLTQELSDAGFKRIIFSSLDFPRDDGVVEYGDLAQTLSKEQICEKLVSDAQALVADQTVILPRMGASRLLEEGGIPYTGEVLVEIAATDLEGDGMTQIVTAIEEKLSGRTVSAAVVREGISDTQLSDLLTALEEAGVQDIYLQ